MSEQYWAVAQTVSKMEHIVRRDIEKGGRGAFVPTFARFSKVDDKDYSKECALLTGYVFFMTEGDDWAGIPDIHGVYRVPANPDGSPQRVSSDEMRRLVIGHAAGEHNETAKPRFTRYYNPIRTPKRKQVRRRSRASKRARTNPNPQSPQYANQV